MVPLSAIKSLLVWIAGVVAATQFSPMSPTTTEKPMTPLQLDAWDRPDCQGAIAFTQFNNSILARNISNFRVCRSFRLNRTLEGQEQLDISMTNDRLNWYPDKDQLSVNSSSCTNFWQTYYASNGSTACHNTPPFTCHRLWNNPGLPYKNMAWSPKVA